MRIDEPRDEELPSLQGDDFGVDAAFLAQDFLDHRALHIVDEPDYVAGGGDGEEGVGEGIVGSEAARVDDRAVVYCGEWYHCDVQWWQAACPWAYKGLYDVFASVQVSPTIQ